MKPCFPVLLLLACPFLAGCLPHYHVDPVLRSERGEWLEGERAHPGDPAYPRALYAVCARLSGSCSVPSEPPLLLTDKVHDRRRGKGEAGTCCLGGLGFAGDALLVTPLRFLRTFLTMPVAWAEEARYRREAKAALGRWKALEPGAGPS